jgi:hypothetical protein
MRKVLFVFVAAALAVPAFAAPNSPSAPGQPEQAPKKEKKICKRVSGSESRISTSVCKTAAEWEKDPSTGEGSRSSISGRPSGY